MNIGSWLQALGLAQYEAAFRDNEIDDKLLLSLTAEDLKDLGVTLVGHRRKLLDAIAVLRAEATGRAPQASPAHDRRETAERRQVTVMFADLVGSTALAAAMDPEDLREVIAAYHRCASETVRRAGGFVSQYLGDGVLVYFGYPQAHEDDAERAVRASLDLIAAVAALNTTRTALQTRVGIATGVVVVGDVVDAGGSQERGIIGETPNLAARLQGIARPNTVVIGDSTRRLLGDLFELQDLGARELKGVVGPVRVWAALHASVVESRFDALHASGLTTLVGREEECEMLLRRWSSARVGEGQVVLLSGEAGIGKSRLTAALLERLVNEPHARVRYFCSPQHTDSALYPIIGQIERAAGFAHDDSPEARLNKLDALLAQTSTSIENAAFFAELLSLPNDRRYPALDELLPQQRRQKTLLALISQMQALVLQQPLLMIFEDAHWTDPTSLELLSRVVGQIPTLRVLLLVTSRPEFEAPWIGRPHVTALTLNRLAGREVGAIIDRISGNRVLPASIRMDIVERTDGIPLFVEEMTKAVLEAGSPEEARQTASAVPTGAVPASLHASLMARLDRLGPAKEVAQIGAAIGREFSHALLAAVMSSSGDDLNSALDRLAASGLIFRQGSPPHAMYLFKHALIQDAAYGIMLREDRRALHGRIVEALEGRFTEVAENQPELLAAEQVERLAHHAMRGELWEKAVTYLRQAGLRAMVRGAYREALAQLEQALGALPHLPESRETTELTIDILVDTRKALMPFADEARIKEHLHAAEALARRLCDHFRLGWIATFMVAHNHTLGQYDESLRYGKEALDIAHTLGNQWIEVVATSHIGNTHLYRGELSDSVTLLERNVALIGDQRTERFGTPLIILAYSKSTLSRARSELGQFDEAIRDAEAAVQIAEGADQPYSLTFGLFALGYAHLHRGDFPSATRILERGLDHCRTWQINRLRIPIAAALGVAYAHAASVDEALTLVAGAVEEFRRNQFQSQPAFTSICAGIICLVADRIDEATGHAREALAVARRVGARGSEAHALHLNGDVASTIGAEDAQDYYRQALALAAPRGMRPLVAHCHLGLARMHLRTGGRDQAHEQLTIATAMYREMNMTYWLKQAEMRQPG